MPVSAAGYQDRIVQLTQGALSAVRTVTVLADAQNDQRVTAACVSTVMDSARDDVATAQARLATEPVDHADSARLDDELAGLLDQAAALVVDDDRAMASSTSSNQLGDQFESFVERHR